ncbi:MAG: AraC family transcriptional regulator [Proteobacteria bacterium]|nr:AraC family transcriptional regulator [Pseudomonadota bacterium]
MAQPMHPPRPPRLERSCAPAPRDWLRTAPAQPGIERLEAFFVGRGYDPHRHDTYAIGLTLDGVQSFDYRGMTEHSRPRHAVVLHPDERHDGRAGTAAGFRYRLAYVEPRLIQAALGGQRALPFVRTPVTRDARLIAALAPALDDLDAPLEDLQRDQIVFDVATALAALDRSVERAAGGAVCWRALEAARAFLDANLERAVRAAELEAITGVNRFALARHFRAGLGTSPYRYLVMRRLDRVRRLMRSDVPLAEVAAASGFADQSHMTRQFKRAYGMSPGRWLRIATP